MAAFVKKLEDMVARIERLSVEQKVVSPKRETEVDDLLKEARSVFDDFRDWQRRQRGDERLAQALDAIGKSLAASYDRLTASEARLAHLEQTLQDRNGQVFDVDPELVKEGEFLKAELAGPPTPGLQARYLKDAPRPDFVPGLNVLRAAMRKTAPAKTTTQKA
jgi:hypothetical protein